MAKQNGTSKKGNGAAKTNGKSNGVSNGKTNGASNDDGPKIDPYKVKVSLRFIVLSIISCWLSSFAVGRIARQMLIIGPQERLLELQAKLELKEQSLQLKIEKEQKDVMQLPNPTLKNKPIPNTVYTAKNLDTARSATYFPFVVMEEVEEEEEEEGVCRLNMSGKKECSSKKAPVEPIIDEGPHYPAGQHLLMDIRNVEEAFLASEERLAKAMLKVVGNCGLTLLSYHCHGLVPAGVSCVGVLLESHVSFHTWPAEGVVTLDLFTCGAQSLLPIVETVESLFGVPRNGEDIESVWAYKVRGYGEESDAELADLFTFPIGTMTEYKKELVSIEKTSQYKQRIDVYDVLRPVFQNYDQYKRSLADDGSYESRYKEIFQPDRILYVDGVLQSRRSAEIPYHEALVHPAMVAHKSPKRVLLLNCGGGAALREVLKHRGVEQVVMVEEEPDVIEVSRKFFPEYHDCSNIQGITPNCMNDTRVELIYSDVFEWTADQYNDETEAEFDVIIMDELYYIEEFVFKDDATDEEEPVTFYLSELLTSDGIFATQVGDAPTLDTAGSGNPNMQDRFDFIDSLQENGFVRIVDYEEGHLGFSNPWQFVLAFKTGEPNEAWDYTYSSWHNMHIDQRTLPSTTGDSSLLHFDGAVMKGYSYPSKASGVVFCRGYPESPFCKSGRGLQTEQE
eukprot:CAMPEP_0116124860 /NCGR_PEP_ID=MMETSP0329-20121206/5507_1 /TAXON_ID=697910 /ORGANISM="Pseudo-nitzschia arenysensis, Strain B593" /LENGTH=676 /DNA_ID=CAMNT_0003618871 /DNA_START=111 /DNA_END=2142 /DNA_ORIENTATION=+